MIRFASCAFALGLASISPALAQTAERSAPTTSVAAGIAFTPDYMGSDEYRVLPIVIARFELAGISFRTEGPGLAAELYSNGPLELGAFARWSGGRDDVEDNIVDLLDDVDNSILLGGYADLTVAQGVFSERDQLSLGVDVGADVLGTYSGVAWNVSADYGVALSQRAFLGLSASVSGYSNDHADTLFSVDAAGALASGLPVFEAEGGVSDIGVTGILNLAVSPEWSVTTVLGYSRLLGDYADSPIVALRGDENQLLAGFAIGRRF